MNFHEKFVNSLRTLLYPVGADSFHAAGSPVLHYIQRSSGYGGRPMERGTRREPGRHFVIAQGWHTVRDALLMLE